MKRLLIVLLLCLVACNPIAMTPTVQLVTPASPTQTETSTATLTPFTDTPTATMTYIPTDTELPPPTATPTPTFTDTSTMRPTLFLTLTATSTPLPPLEIINPLKQTYFYIAPDNVTCTQLPDTFEAYILTYKRETCRDDIRATGYTGLIYQYLRFDGFHDVNNNWGNPGASCAATGFGNQVAFKSGDSCWIRDNHPDWALRRPDGSHIRTGDGYILTDPNNPGWRAFWIERALEMQAARGWYGVFLDNVSAGRQNAGLPLRDYPDDVTYQNAIAGFLSDIRTAFGTRPLGANLIYPTTSDVAYRYSFYLDLVMEEAAYVNWNNGSYSTSQWTNQLTRLENIRQLDNYSHQGVDVLSVAQGTQPDTTRMMFSLASHLLIADERISFRYTNAFNSLYNQVWLYPAYADAARLGLPVTNRRLLADGVTWRRDYQYGFVTANPVTRVGQVVVN